jgi:hypothetical protein
MRREKDPYAPPPRHRDASGAIVRFGIIAVLLGAAAWGWMEYRDQPQTASLVPEAQESAMAESGYEAAPTAEPAASTQSPEATTPAEVPEMAPEPPA